MTKAVRINGRIFFLDYIKEISDIRYNNHKFIFDIHYVDNGVSVVEFKFPLDFIADISHLKGENFEAQVKQRFEDFNTKVVNLRDKLVAMVLNNDNPIQELNL